MKPPTRTELEVSIFGPGYGEAIAIHVGNGDWILVDSCIDPENGEPQSLRYLINLGVDVSKQVKFVVASHWHDDHIRGLRQLVQECTGAQFACSSALSDKEFIAYSRANSDPGISRLARSTAEIRAILDILAARNSDTAHLSVNSLLYEPQDSVGISVFALSPSYSTVASFLKRIANSMPQAMDPRVKSTKINPNDLSVVILIRTPGDGILLGGDLEEAGSAGWTSILKKCQVQLGKSSLFKIPHHGSSNAHCADVWDEILEQNPVTAITPWRMGGAYLPTPDDVSRILTLAPRSYITANPVSLAPYRRSKEVEKQLREGGVVISLQQARPGHLRFRKEIAGGDWDISAFATARHLSTLQPVGAASGKN